MFWDTKKPGGLSRAFARSSSVSNSGAAGVPNPQPFVGAVGDDPCRLSSPPFRDGMEIVVGAVARYLRAAKVSRIRQKADGGAVFGVKELGVEDECGFGFHVLNRFEGEMAKRVA